MPVEVAGSQLQAQRGGLTEQGAVVSLSLLLALGTLGPGRGLMPLGTLLGRFPRPSAGFLPPVLLVHRSSGTGCLAPVIPRTLSLLWT